MNSHMGPWAFRSELRMRFETRGLIVRFGMPDFRFTISSSDSRSPLVILWAGVDNSNDILSTSD
jgi:hypothetical protein